jgi:hypothetical protein
MEHRDPHARHDQQGEHGGVGMDEPSQSGADRGEDQAKRRHPAHGTAIGNEPDQKLWHGAAHGRCQGQAGGGCIAVVAFQDEERDRRGHKSLVEIIDGVGAEPHAHPPPLRHARAIHRGQQILGWLKVEGIEMHLLHGRRRYGSAPRLTSANLPKSVENPS